VILARYVLDGIGLDQNRDFQAIYLERAGEGPAMVLHGRAAALWPSKARLRRPRKLSGPFEVDDFKSVLFPHRPRPRRKKTARLLASGTAAAR
jgi:hypothetical protein